MLKAFLQYTTVCMAQCPVVVLSSGRLGVVLGVVTACCTHTSRDVVRCVCAGALRAARVVIMAVVASFGTLFRSPLRGVRSACQLITALRELAGPTGGAYSSALVAAFMEAGACRRHAVCSQIVYQTP